MTVPSERSGSRIARLGNWLALALLITGFVMSILVAGTMVREFRSVQNQRIDVPVLQPEGDTLFLKMVNEKNFRDESYYSENDIFHTPWPVIIQSDSLKINDVNLDIIRSKSGQFELVQIGSAR